MSVTPLPSAYLIKDRSVSISVAQTKMEAGSDVHRITIGFDPTIEKMTLKWVAPPAYVLGTLYPLFCVQDHLVGIYSITNAHTGETSTWQTDGDFTWQQSGMTRWPASLPVRRA